VIHLENFQNNGSLNGGTDKFPGVIESIADLILENPPQALAQVRGSAQYPDIEGIVAFYPDNEGVLVLTAVTGLPAPTGECGNTVHGMHIHDGGSCSGNENDPFAEAGTHYNPGDCPHPEHAGDLPPLFASDGSAWNAVLLGRFGIDEVIGKTVVIHQKYDDFETQPSGDSGLKIACGVIVGL
jgi:Cu/Zn superoxide dismutase